MTDASLTRLMAAHPTLSLPESFLTGVASEISEVEELHASLAAFRLALTAGGFDHPVAEESFETDPWLRRALRIEGSPNAPLQRIAKGIALAAGRGTLLRFTTHARSEHRVWYYLNTIENHARLGRMASGTLAPPDDVRHGDSVPVIELEQPNVFRLYEQNIGLLTPLIAERIVGALERYSTAWIEDAIAEAVTYNRRNWRYISRILENWAVAGRGDSREAASYEDHRRRDSNALDPDEYKHGRHLDRSGRH